MNSDFGMDIGEILRNVDSAEVLAIYFPVLRKTLLVDTRYDDVEGPLVKVVPMAGSVEERIRNLRRMRPRFDRPHTITVMPWPKYVGSLDRLGILNRLVQRFHHSGHSLAAEACQKAYLELMATERQELLHAITGEGYNAIWQRKR